MLWPLLRHLLPLLLYYRSILERQVNWGFVGQKCQFRRISMFDMRFSNFSQLGIKREIVWYGL
jgi:hypothetical protein